MSDTVEKITGVAPLKIVQLFQLPYQYFSRLYSGGDKYRLLDCASGNNFQRGFLERMGWEVISLDKESDDPRVLLHNLEYPLPFYNDRFDVAFSFETIEHLQEKFHRPFVEELLRVAPSVIIGSVSTDGPSHIGDAKIFRACDGDNPYHVKEYGAEDWCDFFRGFSDVCYVDFFHSTNTLDVEQGLNPANGISNFARLERR